MSLTLLVPDLFWPDLDATEPYVGLVAPRLARLLGHGRHAPVEADCVESWCAHATGESPSRAPFAAWARLGRGAWTGPAVFASIVHLEARGAELFLTDGAALDVSDDESAALLASVAPLFADDGLAFEPHDPHLWCVTRAEPIHLETTPVAAAHGRSIDALRPRGDDARRFASIGAEIEMLLHDHPVNTARELRGLPTLNAVWWWGAGGRTAADLFAALDRSGGVLPDEARSRWRHVVGRPDWLHGWARTQRGTTVDEREALTGSNPGPTLILDERLRGPAMRGDLAAWRQAVAQFDAGLLDRALGAVRAGRHSTLHLVGLGARRGIEVLWTPADRWKLWRRARPLDASLLGS
jgi:hypothetical protein